MMLPSPNRASRREPVVRAAQLLNRRSLSRARRGGPEGGRTPLTELSSRRQARPARRRDNHAVPQAGADLRQQRSWAYENPRPEVQALVPTDARRILDVGCSSGRLGEALKQRQAAEVVGVELDP